MAIQVVRNDRGNIIEFKGSSQPIYWNNALSAVVNSLSADTLDIINITGSVDITALSGRSYEFFQMPFTEFLDLSGDTFPNTLSAVSYINEAANATVLTVDDSAGYVGFITKYYDFAGTNITQHLSADIFNPIVGLSSAVYDENILPAQGISNATNARELIYSSKAELSAILSPTFVPGDGNAAVDVGTPALDSENMLTSSSKPVMFSFAGQGAGSFDSFRIVMNVTPEENESALDIRLVFVTNPTSTVAGVSSFELSRRTLTFNGGADITYTHQETFAYYAGDTLKDLDEQNPSWDNSGFFFVEAKPDVDMDFELLSMTNFANK